MLHTFYKYFCPKLLHHQNRWHFLFTLEDHLHSLEDVPTWNDLTSKGPFRGPLGTPKEGSSFPQLCVQHGQESKQSQTHTKHQNPIWFLSVLHG